jgi:hypothetical protein
VELG